MALEDIASFRAIHGSTVLHPSDANQTAKLVAAMADARASRSSARCAARRRCARAPDEDVRIGGSRDRRTTATTSRSSPAASRVDEAVKAAEALEGDGIHARVLDCLLDQADRRRRRPRRGARLRRDRHRRGPLARGRARRRGARGARRRRRPRRRCVKLAVREMPGSGTPEELIHGAGIDAEAIAGAAREVARAAAAH